MSAQLLWHWSDIVLPKLPSWKLFLYKAAIWSCFTTKKWACFNKCRQASKPRDQSSASVDGTQIWRAATLIAHLVRLTSGRYRLDFNQSSTCIAIRASTNLISGHPPISGLEDLPTRGRFPLVKHAPVQLRGPRRWADMLPHHVTILCTSESYTLFGDCFCCLSLQQRAMWLSISADIYSGNRKSSTYFKYIYFNYCNNLQWKLQPPHKILKLLGAAPTAATVTL